MKTKSIHKIIRHIESQLTWPVVRIMHEDSLDIISDPRKRVHTIRFPADSQTDPVRDIEYLHELAHAYLAEREPVFCVHDFITNGFSGMTIENALKLVSDPVRITSDWFVDDLVLQWEPTEQKKYIIEHVELLRRGLADSVIFPDALVLAAGHIFAQGIHYCKIKIPCPEPIKQIINMFLSVDPHTPTQANFSKLFNSLLTPSGLSATWEPSESAWVVPKQ